MKNPHVLDKIDLQLIRTLQTLLIERSVSKAALRLGQQQPAVSLALKRLRALTGDPILVRAGSGMTPTDVGLRMLDPANRILDSARNLFLETKAFNPQQAQETFRIAAGDTLDPLFLPHVVARIKAQAPLCHVEIHALSAQAQYAEHLSQGLLDVVIGNWISPSEALHRAHLLDDEVVCLVGQHHPAVRRGWSAPEWLACEHIAPTSAYPGWRGVIDEHLDQLGLTRHISARCAHFGLIPHMVASSLLVLTTGRQYCSRFVQEQRPQSQTPNPWVILPCPVDFPRMQYYALWHDRSHASPAHQWLREQVKISAAHLPSVAAPQPLLH
jgi:DNA-binding transcriptional LysR family regulator